MTDTGKPVPCWWCGAQTETDMLGGKWHFVACTDIDHCSVCGPMRTSASEAIADWNRVQWRPKP